jgi:hypothetical protein
MCVPYYMAFFAIVRFSMSIIRKKISTVIKTDIEKWAIAKNVDYVVLKLFLSMH